ncbi:MAG TPA: hypothetical protein PKC76_18730 [Saprospiraceae bacterium]|nr:hypothetical protein [Saprospiraceae bacterium]HMP26171.1 hypothetical protein [Saprospiraceae bacterium]
MENKLLDRLGQSFKVEMPPAETLNDYIDAVLPKVRAWSEDLREEQFYVGRPWMEIRDDDLFHAVVLHFFNPEGEYIKSVNGDLSMGTWRYQNNKMMILLDEGELFDLAYLDGQFFVLKKNGTHREYFFMTLEHIGRPLQHRWRDLVEMLFRRSQSNISFYILIGIAVLLVLVIFLILR